MLREAFGVTQTLVVLSIILLAHGYVLKVSTFTIAGKGGYFESIGFLAIVAYLIIASEIFGGLALIIEPLRRLVAWLSIPILVGVTRMHLENNWVFFHRAVGRNSPFFS